LAIGRQKHEDQTGIGLSPPSRPRLKAKVRAFDDRSPLSLTAFVLLATAATGVSRKRSIMRRGHVRTC